MTLHYLIFAACHMRLQAPLIALYNKYKDSKGKHQCLADISSSTHTNTLLCCLAHVCPQAPLIALYNT
jgi:hypothetical protein